MINLSENIKRVEESSQKVHDHLVVMKFINEKQAENIKKMQELVEKLKENEEERKQLKGENIQ